MIRLRLLFKAIFISILIITVSFSASEAQVSINDDGTPPDPDAMLEIKSSDKGLLIPRLNAANRPASPPAGMMIYQTDGSSGFYYYDGSGWVKVGDAADDYWLPATGSDIRFPYGIALGTYSTTADYRINAQNYSAGKSAVRGVSQTSIFPYAEGHLGVLNYSGNPLNLPLDVPNIGVLGIKPDNGLNGTGIYGWNTDTDSENYAGIFYSSGDNSSTNIGIYAASDSGFNNYAAKMKGRMLIEGHNHTSGAADSTSHVLESQVTHSQSIDTRALYGLSSPTDGYGIGVYGVGGYMGVRGLAQGGDYGFSVYGVYGSASGNGTGTRIGVYGSASGGTSNWAGYFSGDAYISSDLRIGTTDQYGSYSLSVNGLIACEGVRVEDSGTWPDYVFKSDYNLMSIKDLEKNIQQNGHLPGIPSAKQIEKEGFELADMQRRVLEKVEELTLYTIDQEKRIEMLQNRMEELEKENKKLRKKISRK